MNSHPPSPSPLSQRAGYAAALATVVLWASAFPVIGLALRSFEPIPLAALRFGVAAILWGVWLASRRHALPGPRDLLRLAGCAAIGIAAYNALLNTGQTSVSAGAASFIVNTVPVITAILAVLFLKERYTIWAWVGTGISFAGVAVIAAGQPGGLSFGAGAMLVFAAAACQAIFFVLQRPLIAALGAKVCAGFVIILGAACLSPWLPAAAAQANHASWPALAAVLYLGVFPGAIGYATWGVAQNAFGAGRAANFLYLVPPTAVALSFGIVGEAPARATLIGGALAIAGVILMNAKGRPAGGPT